MPEEELAERAGPQVPSEPTGPSLEGLAPEAAEPDARPRAYKVIHPAKPRLTRPTAPREALPLSPLAGVLGLLSLAFVWNYEPSVIRGYDLFTALRYMSDVGEYDPLYSVIVLLIMVGSVLCFVTALGSLLQLGGIVLYAFELAAGPVMSGPGPFVAVAATLIGVASLLISPVVKVPQRFLSFTRRERGDLSVNVMALSAFVLGVLSVLLIWVVRSYSIEPSYLDYIYAPDPDRYTLLSFLSDTRVDEYSWMIVGVSLLVTGSVMCLLTPLGSFIQMVGTALSFLEVRSSFENYRQYSFWRVEVDFGAGFYVAIVATAVGLASMVFVWRLDVPGRFPSGALASSDDGPGADLESSPALGTDRVRPRTPVSLVDRVPQIGRALMAVAIVLALAISALAVPGVLPVSTLKLSVVNASPLYDLDLEVYVDGEAVSSGTVTPLNEHTIEQRVRSGIHTLSLDYAFSGDEDPALDGSIDWSSSVDVDPYLTSTVAVGLTEGNDARAPQANLSCASSPEGYVITLESVFRYDAYTGTQFTDIGWSMISLVVVETYVSGVGWYFHDYELDDVPYDTEYCGIEHLGSLGLNCTAFDISGDGEAGGGDFITLSVSEGEFSSSEYVAYLLYEPIDIVMGQVTIRG